MRVELSDEQEFLREAVAGVLAREATPAHVREWADAHDPSSADALAVRQGWTGIGLDEALGGQGGGIIELAVMAEQLGRAVTPWDRLLGSALALQMLGASPGDLGRELAAAVAEGERRVGLCVDGRRLPAPWPESVLSSGALTLDAAYVPGGADADLLVPVAAGESVRLLRVDASEAEAIPTRLVDHTRSLARVRLSGAAATDLGTVPSSAMERAAACSAVLVGADALGAAAQLLDTTVAYIADRRQFGVPVGSFQAVKHAAAMMLVDVEAARSAIRYASWAVDGNAADAGIWASIAKVGACGSATHVADTALFLHGAIGYTWEHDLQFAFKRTKSDVQLFGDPDAHRDRIADQLELVPAAA